MHLLGSYPFSKAAIARVLRKGDFASIKASDFDRHRAELIEQAASSVCGEIATRKGHLRATRSNGREVFCFNILSDEIAARAVWRDIRGSLPKPAKRTEIVQSVIRLLEEGTPFRVYRFDIQAFFESFQSSVVLSAIESRRYISQNSKFFLQQVLRDHWNRGYPGIPRGLCFSSSLAEILMHSFDVHCSTLPGIFFYARYVDDVLLIYDREKPPREIASQLKSFLPGGCVFNRRKTQSFDFSEVQKSTSSVASVSTIDYLGYAFRVSSIRTNLRRSPAISRKVVVDIAARKVLKYKTRLCSSFLDFQRNHDWLLLVDRIRFLTHNFGVFKATNGKNVVAGIYFSYPSLSQGASKLRELDAYLRGLVLGSCKIRSSTSLSFNSKQKRRLLSYSFESGHAQRRFIYFSPHRISEIQSCWERRT